MSDYLGMLAARYLNQAGSIRPEPVSVYQPPSPDWQLAVDSSRSDDVAVDEPGLPISPAQPIAIDNGEGWPIAIDDGEDRRLSPTPSGGGPGAAALDVRAEPPMTGRAQMPARDAQPSPAQPSPREPDVVAQPTSADDVDLAPAAGRGAVPAPGAPPSPPQPSTRDRDVVQQATDAETVSIKLAGAPPPPSPGSPGIPSPSGEASSIPSTSEGGQVGTAPNSRTEPSIAEREIETFTQQPPEAVRSLAVERSPGPGQPVHPSPAPRVERAADRRATSPTPTENKEPGRLPLPSVVFSDTAQARSESRVAALAPSTVPTGIAHWTIEPFLPRVAPSSAHSQIGQGRIEPSLRPFVQSLPLPRPAERRIDARLPQFAPTETLGPTGRQIKPDTQPIVEITIDEISIRAALPQPAPATPRRERLVHPPMSLEDYLRRRSGSVSR